MAMDAPGSIGLEDAELLDSMLVLPGDAVSKVDDAAPPVRVMNANTFTSGAFMVKEGEGVSAVAGAIKENVMARQWICSFQDKLVIMAAENYAVSAFGEQSIIDTLQARLSRAYPQAKIACEESLA